MNVAKFGSLIVSHVDGEIVVTRGGDDTGYVIMTRCLGDPYQWTMLRNRCYPFNGSLGKKKPPVGRWIVRKFRGREKSSTDEQPRLAKKGFTDREVYAIVEMVNLAF